MKIRQIIIVLAFCAAAGCSARKSAPQAATYRLSGSGQLKQAGDAKEEQFLLRVSEMKRLVNAGKPDKVKKAIKQLRADFPEIAGADFNAFTDGEILLAKGKLTKAFRKYEKFLDEYPASPLRDAALEREFGIASDCLAGRRKRVLLVFNLSRYEEGVKIMEKIADRAGTTEIAQRASLAVVAYYEKHRKFDEAYHKWSEIQTRWPTGQLAKDALEGMARTKYATFRGRDYDASGLISARSYYENYKLRYPEDAEKLQVNDILLRINEQLAEKQLTIAQYYDRTGSKGPANMYYQLVVDDYPDTKAAVKARERLSKK